MRGATPLPIDHIQHIKLTLPDMMFTLLLQADGGRRALLRQHAQHPNALQSTENSVHNGMFCCPAAD